MKQVFQRGTQTKPPFYVANIIERKKKTDSRYEITILICHYHITIFHVTHGDFMEIFMDEYNLPTTYLSFSLKIRCIFLFITSFIIFSLLFKSYRTCIDIDHIISLLPFARCEVHSYFSRYSYKNLYHLLITDSVFIQHFSRHPLRTIR